MSLYNKRLKKIIVKINRKIFSNKLLFNKIIQLIKHYSKIFKINNNLMISLIKKIRNSLKQIKINPIKNLIKLSQIKINPF